ncbi:MAG: hypothetical protein ABI175_12815 [Polyangiales bacterium]
MFTSRHVPPPSPATAALLASHYGEPHRAYHNATHIAEVLGWFDWVWDQTGWDAAADVHAAVLFHDVIYDPLAKDNEARSAALAVSHGASARASELILLTARHGALTSDDVDRDAAHFLDSDTAILGAEPHAFDAYDAAIRREYAAVPEDAFVAGRGTFLRTMLERPRIFLSELFHAELDARARANLARAAARYRR